MEVAVSPVLVTHMAEARQATGVDARIVVMQQLNDGGAPDVLYLFLFKEQLSPGAVLRIPLCSITDWHGTSITYWHRSSIRILSPFSQPGCVNFSYCF
ncbi:hypothetical protein, partial [Serratia sp. N21D137]|uniref:hypothetical protein n=1 Tax=Serratia sp. N21D137 TaxID=3397495 RepID=UPI0039E1FB20